MPTWRSKRHWNQLWAPRFSETAGSVFQRWLFRISRVASGRKSFRTHRMPTETSLSGVLWIPAGWSSVGTFVFKTWCCFRTPFFRIWHERFVRLPGFRRHSRSNPGQEFLSRWADANARTSWKVFRIFHAEWYNGIKVQSAACSQGNRCCV